MKTTRLTSNHRAALQRLASRIVDVPAETKAEEAAYKKASAIVRAIVEEAMPPAEMKVLAKYDLAEPDDCIRVTLADGTVEQFRFREGDAPLVAARGNCRNRMFLADTPTASKAIDAWVDANKAMTTAREAKLAKYDTFIENAKTYEEVLEVWPEAIEISDRIRLNLPIALSVEILEEIKADSARRVKATAKAA